MSSLPIAVSKSLRLVEDVVGSVSKGLAGEGPGLTQAIKTIKLTAVDVKFGFRGTETEIAIEIEVGSTAFVVAIHCDGDPVKNMIGICCPNPRVET